MDVSTMFNICRYCVFTLWGRHVTVFVLKTHYDADMEKVFFDVLSLQKSGETRYTFTVKMTFITYKSSDIFGSKSEI